MAPFTSLGCLLSAEGAKLTLSGQPVLQAQETTQGGLHSGLHTSMAILVHSKAAWSGLEASNPQITSSQAAGRGTTGLEREKAACRSGTSSSLI